MNPILKILLFPISVVYGFFILIRNFMFDVGIIKEKKYSIPIVNVGNLSVGGTGKTPHIEYLIRLLSPHYRIAVLSRGYHRKTRGYLKAEASHTFLDLGDEPLQYFQKFPNITVTVCESRRKGIKNLLNDAIPPEVILLDDAYQHRYVKPSTNILLTDYMDLYSKDFVIPCGKLREFRSGAKRADAVIVTKTELVLSSIVKSMLSEDLHLLNHQKLFFSYITYDDPVPLFEDQAPHILHYVYIQLVAGIANPYPLEAFLKTKCTEFSSNFFPDHHIYTKSDINKIVSEFKNHISVKKMIITTEKDAQRFKYFKELLKDIPIFYLPIKVVFHPTASEESFDEWMLNNIKRGVSV